MKALILCDATQNTSPGQRNVLVAANCCHSVGIEPIYITATSTWPAVTDFTNSVAGEMFYDIDLIIVPSVTSATASLYSRFMGGNINKPVFVLAKNYLGSFLQGVITNTWADNAAGWYYTQISSGPKKGHQIIINGRRNIIDTDGVAILNGGDVGDNASAADSVAAWKYVGSGSTVYYSATDIGTNAIRFNPFHLLLDEAISDGVLSAPPHPAPCFLVLDHINDAGEGAAAGGMGGWQENPEPLKVLGDYLRSIGGVALASIERQWQDGTEDATLIANGQPAGGNPTLLSYLTQYQDVFKVCPYHDHNQAFATASSVPTDPVTAARSTSEIDTIISETVTAIQAYGMQPDYTFGHFANDRGNDNVWQVANPDTGYGLRFARTGSVNESWPAQVRGSDDNFAPPMHWLYAPKHHRGITFIPGFDGGHGSVLGAPNAEQKNIYQYCWSALTRNLMHGTLAYFHAEDFEDVAWRTANLAGNPITTSGGVWAVTYGQAAVEMMGGYAQACPHTVKFGAHPADYR